MNCQNKEEQFPLCGGVVLIEKTFITKYACKRAILGCDLILRNKEQREARKLKL